MRETITGEMMHVVYELVIRNLLTHVDARRMTVELEKIEFGTVIDAYHFNDEVNAVIVVNPVFDVRLVAAMYAAAFATDALLAELSDVTKQMMNHDLMTFAFPEDRIDENGRASAAFSRIGRKAPCRAAICNGFYIVELLG